MAAIRAGKRGRSVVIL
ncbi:hypothetical protein AB9E21_34870, partial [Rhizobium leguminosarum]